MSTLTEDDPDQGVEFVYEDDGRVTARDLETGVASFGETKAEALEMLADALRLEEGGGESIDDEEAFLEELDIDPAEVEETEDLPEFLE